MTSEKNLTEEFFKVFGIEPSCPQGCAQIGLSQNCDECAFYDCPPITDKILLEMICINSQKGGIEIFNTKNVEELKNSIIQHCIDRLSYALNKEQYKAKIQQLFEEEN